MCTESGDYRIRAGQFSIDGPWYALNNQVTSLAIMQTFADGNGGADTTKVTAGHELQLLLTLSSGFASGDQLIVIKDEDTCGDSVESDAINGPYNLESFHSTEMGNEAYPIVNINSGSYNQFKNIVLNIPSLYKFCWCPKSAIDAGECLSSGQGFIVPLGKILVEGPDGLVEYAESQASMFSLNLHGSKLDENNRIRIVHNSVGNCGAKDSKTMVYKITGSIPENGPSTHSSSNTAT